MNNLHSSVAVIALGVLTLWTGPACGAGPFERLYHTTETVLPGSPPALESISGVDRSGSGVVFRVTGTDYQAIYQFDGEVFRSVVDTRSFLPDIGGSLVGLGTPAISGASVAFMGRGPGLQDGIFVSDGVGVRRVFADGGPSPVDPTKTVQILSPEPVAYTGERLVFRDFGGGRALLDVRDGGVTPVVYRGQPGAPTSFDWFDTQYVARGETTVFTGGFSPSAGVWKADKAGISPIAQRGEPIPGASGEVFFDVWSPRINEYGVVALLGKTAGTGVGGVYADDGSGLRAVFDTTTTWEGERITMGPSDTLAFAGDRVVFGGFLGSFSGSFSGGFYRELFTVKLDGTGLDLLLSQGDTVDGRIVDVSRVYANSIEGNGLLVAIRFMDGTGGLYMTTVPAPGGIAALSIAGLLATRRRR